MGQGLLMIVLIAMALLSIGLLAAAIAFDKIWHAADAMEKYNAD
jgi:type II secretory pathway component PulJ